jgi:DNA-binding NarL/FixJ family response regulator
MQITPTIDESAYAAVGVSAGNPQTDEIIEREFCGVDQRLRLTPREAEILRLIIAGKSNKEIALTISRVERTVEYHRNHLMRKLNAHNISELFKKAISMGVTLS